MLRPDALATSAPHGPTGSRGADIWEALRAAASGEAPALRALLARDPGLSRAAYAGRQPLDFAVRGGHLEAALVLLDAGADPARLTAGGEELAAVADERGHTAVAELLRSRIDASGTLRPGNEDPPVHAAIERDDLPGVLALLDADARQIEARDRAGATPLHRAVAADRPAIWRALLDRGADVHALHAAGPASAAGYAPAGFEAVDLALWSGPFWKLRGDLATAKELLAHGARLDLVLAAALGEEETVRALLDAAPEAVDRRRKSGKGALSSAVEFGHTALVRLLLARGADPNAPEGDLAPRGLALHAAARAGDRDLVELLLAHGADPDAALDSAGSATYAAKTPELRALLRAHGGHLDPYDLVWLDEDAEALALVAADPRTAHAGCGTVFAAACTLGKRDLVESLLAAGARFPPVVDGCRSYLLEDPELLRLLLRGGMDPDLPSWLGATPLHELCGRDGRGRPRPKRVEAARVLLAAGATLRARDEEHRSTPLAWAARHGLGDMVELLLGSGAPPLLADDPPWATPLAWALRRGHGEIAERLRRAGASA